MVLPVEYKKGVDLFQCFFCVSASLGTHPNGFSLPHAVALSAKAIRQVLFQFQRVISGWNRVVLGEEIRAEFHAELPGVPIGLVALFVLIEPLVRRPRRAAYVKTCAQCTHPGIGITELADLAHGRIEFNDIYVVVTGHGFVH